MYSLLSLCKSAHLNKILIEPGQWQRGSQVYLYDLIIITSYNKQVDPHVLPMQQDNRKDDYHFLEVNKM